MSSLLKPKILFVDWNNVVRVWSRYMIRHLSVIDNKSVKQSSKTTVDTTMKEQFQSARLVLATPTHRKLNLACPRIHIRYVSVSIVSAKYFSTPDAKWSPYFRYHSPFSSFLLFHSSFHRFYFHFKVFAVTSFSDLYFLTHCSSSSSLSQTSSLRPSLPSLYNVLSLLFSFFLQMYLNKHSLILAYTILSFLLRCRPILVLLFR